MAKQRLSKKEKRAKDFIDMAFKTHEEPWLKTAKRLLDEYYGKYNTVFGDKPRFVVNTIFSLVNLLLPNLAFNRPHIQVKPTHAKYFKKLVDGEYKQVDNLKAARIMEAVINHKYIITQGMEAQRQALFDAFFYGFGITKVGYSVETYNEDDQDYIEKDEAYIKRVNPQDFGWHPLASSLDDSPMLVHRILTTIDKLKKNKNYKNVDQLEPEIPKHMMERLDSSTQSLLNSSKNGKQGLTSGIEDFGYVTLYEVYDQTEDMIYTYAGSNKILLEKKENPYSFVGPHFQIIRFAGDNDRFLGVPLLAMVEDEAIALNEILTLTVEHARKFPGMLFYNHGAIDEDDIERIKTGSQGSMHGVNDITQLQLTNPLSMGSDYFNLVSLLNGLIDRILGIPDFQRATSSTRRSATEASYIQGDATAKRDYFLQLVKTFMLDGIEKLAALAQQYQDNAEEIQASGELNWETFEYDKSDIQGKFNFNFDIDSLRIFNEAEVNNLNNALNILASHQVLHPFLLKMNPNKLGRKLLLKLGIDPESVQHGEIEEETFVNPAKEDELARKDQPMPTPKKGENHDFHIKIHSLDLQENGENDQILDHLAVHMLLKREVDGEIPGTQGPPQVDPNAAQAGPQGPVGPMQQTPVTPVE